MLKKIVSFCGILAIVSLVPSCNSGAKGSYTSNEKFDLSLRGPLQKRAFDYEGPFRNPVIIVHGFLGSNMLDTKTGKCMG